MLKPAIVYTVACAAILTACDPIGDDTFIVRGQITDMVGSVYDMCRLDVYEAGGALVDHMAIEGRFVQTVFIAPGSSRYYYCMIGCRDTSAIFKTDVFQIGPSNRVNPIDLGLIVLERPQ